MWRWVHLTSHGALLTSLPDGSFPGVLALSKSANQTHVGRENKHIFKSQLDVPPAGEQPVHVTVTLEPLTSCQHQWEGEPMWALGHPPFQTDKRENCGFCLNAFVLNPPENSP